MKSMIRHCLLFVGLPLMMGLSVHCDILSANDDLSQVEIDAIVHEAMDSIANDPGCNAEDILKEIELEKVATEAEKRAKKIDALMWQNTLMTTKTLGSGFFQVGLYNSDLIEGSFLLADTIADVELYKSLTRRRIDHIMKSLIDDSDGLIKILKRTNASEARFEERMRLSQGTVSKLFANKGRAQDILLNPLRRYILENHSIITGYNPFNKKTMVPLLLRWGWDRLSLYLERQLLVPSPLQNIDEAKETFTDYNYPELLDAHFYANEVTPNGGIVRAKDTVFSATTLARFCLQPFTALRKKMGNFSNQQDISYNISCMSYAGKFAGVKVPQFLSSPYVSLGLDVLSIGFAGYYYDELNTQRWTAFVLCNREKLLNKIFAYRKALTDQSSGELAIKVARQDLRDFVEFGHQTSSMIPGMPLFEWLGSKEKGKKNVLSKLSLATSAFLLLAAGKFIYQLRNSA